MTGVWCLKSAEKPFIMRDAGAEAPASSEKRLYPENVLSVLGVLNVPPLRRVTQEVEN